MLVLSRRVNESIQIGEDVEVFVVDIRGDVVRLGINAPKTTQIWRKELWDSIVAANRQAADFEASQPDAAPRLPLSTFSKLSKLKTVKVGGYKRDDPDGTA
ncbi:MAG: carbon storage regulator CsrA [Synergistaceae bacterium]|jgi:carbon storage regulator|nr:carbon storage regulator CsrA [Synergistaceae bacterium]